MTVILEYYNFLTALQYENMAEKLTITRGKVECYIWLKTTPPQCSSLRSTQVLLLIQCIKSGVAIKKNIICMSKCTTVLLNKQVSFIINDIVPISGCDFVQLQHTLLIN